MIKKLKSLISWVDFIKQFKDSIAQKEYTSAKHIIIKEMASSDNEVQVQDDQHSIWNGRLKTNSKEAKFFLEFLDALGARFDGMPVDDILQTFWGEPRDVLEKLIKKSNKHEKKVKAKFAPVDLKKPLTANLLFQRDFRIKCDTNKIKFDLKDCNNAYKNLSEKEKTKYIHESNRLKEQYKVEYERLREEAIRNGAFPADKPKKPLSGYFRYLQEVRAEITQKYVDETDRKSVNAKIVKEAAEMWKALTDSEREPYETAYKTEKAQYDIIIKKWESQETDRRNKGVGASASASASAGVEIPVTVKIETSGETKKTTKGKASKGTTSPAVVAPVDTELNESETEEPIQKATTKPKTVKTK